MHQTERDWARNVLGLNDSFTDEDVDRASTELKNLWSLHVESTNPKVQEQGREEFDKIERAKQVLQSPVREEAPPGKELRPMVLGVLVTAAFVVGFGGMYLYRITHRPPVSLMIPNTMFATGSTVRLDAPDVSVSSRPIGSSSTNAESQADADEARVNEDLAGLNGDDPGVPLNDIKSMGSRAIPGLTAALASTDSDRRKTAAATINLLAGTASESTDQPEDGPNVKQAFAQARTVQALAQLTDDDDAETRQIVAEALGNMGDTAALDPLVDLSTDSEPDVRSKVADSIAKLGDNEGISTLSALLEDSEPSVRISAAEALGKFGGVQEAHSALTDRLGQEPDDDVKKSILTALGLPTNIDEKNL